MRSRLGRLAGILLAAFKCSITTARRLERLLALSAHCVHYTSSLCLRLISQRWWATRCAAECAGARPSGETSRLRFMPAASLRRRTVQTHTHLELKVKILLKWVENYTSSSSHLKIRYKFNEIFFILLVKSLKSLTTQLELIIKQYQYNSTNHPSGCWANTIEKSSRLTTHLSLHGQATWVKNSKRVGRDAVEPARGRGSHA